MNVFPRASGVHSQLDLLLANPLWQALFNERQQRTGRAANLIWRLFLSDESTVLGNEAGTDHFARSMISDLHDAAGRYPDDRDVTSMIADLRAASERFTQLWDRYTVAPQISERKTILSSTVGPVTVDCDILTARGSDLRIVVYTAPRQRRRRQTRIAPRRQHTDLHT